MKYKITKQYARDTENISAEFSDLNEANFFIERKLLSDGEKALVLIYRLYDHHKLLKEYNKEKITSRINNAQYAEGDRDFPDSLGPYKVCQDDPKAPALAAFTDLADAELFVEDKLTQTEQITHYYIFNNNVMIFESNQHVKKKVTSEESTHQGKGSTASFRPTPLNTAPRPPGSPHNWNKDDDKDEEKK